MTRTLILAAAAAFALSAALVGWIRSAAQKLEILDHPNDRSSHSVSTPRGGGAGMIAVLLLVILIALWRAELLTSMFVFPVLGVALVAVVGWIDDRKSIGVLPRLAAHIVGGVSVLALFLPIADAGPMKWVFAAWWIFWAVASINVVNFIDGIDGLVGSQFLLFGVGVAVLAKVCGGSFLPELVGFAIAGAAAGFLVWNWAPAKIFLGDSGSGGAGLAMVGAGALLNVACGVNIVAVFLPLYAVFLDALVTIVRRAKRRENLTVAHRSHLYQRLGNGPWGHARTSLAYAAAAAFGIAVSVEYQARWWPLLAGAYGAVVLVIGIALDRRAPAA